MLAAYLRQQANTCLAWSRDCFDLGTAERLRLMAEELNVKARAIEAQSDEFDLDDSPHHPAAFEIRSDAS